MTNYARKYRFGITPWERYGRVAAAKSRGVDGLSYVVGDVTRRT
jgi:hypothetical protein